MPKEGYRVVTIADYIHQKLEEFKAKVIRELGTNLSLGDTIWIALYLADKWLKEHPGQLGIEMYKLALVQHLQYRKQQINKQATNQLLQ
ncbi:MAG: hypothetical protein RQ842_06375 [Vulcanisaeta sp.]|nr:hypothetical protein [Vulcanisaeta sp.]MDT7970174.1 hypothetical protein [Vulcanisaeta sp.]